jgi:hypothetical protein
MDAIGPTHSSKRAHAARIAATKFLNFADLTLIVRHLID